MKALTFSGLAAAAACLAFSAQAQQQPDYPTAGYDYYGQGQPNAQSQAPTGNVQSYQSYNRSYQDYQGAMSAYDAARDSAAQQRETYNRNAYDAEYGPGAYEAYYAPPPPPY